MKANACIKVSNSPSSDRRPSVSLCITSPLANSCGTQCARIVMSDAGVGPVSPSSLLCNVTQNLSTEHKDCMCSPAPLSMAASSAEQ